MDTKLWREKILANCKRFTKILLSKIFLPKSSSSYLVYSQLANQYFETERYVVILRIYSKSYRLHSDSQVTSATLVKSLSYFCHIVFQPADNQQVHPTDTSHKMELQSIANCCFIASQLYCSHTWLDPIFVKGIYCLQYKRGCLYCKR